MSDKLKLTEDPILDERIGSFGNVQSRLKELKGSRTLRQIAEVWDIPLSTVNGWIIRGSQPPIETAAKVAKAEGVNLQWLATGEGPKRGSTNSIEQEKPVEPEPSNDAVDMSHLVSVPSYEVDAAAGAGVWIDAENINDYWYVPKTWLRQERLVHAELCIINTVGDSMAPNINHGDRLLVKTNIDREVALSGVYVINLDGCLRVKRLEFTLYPVGYRITSDNELYPEEFIPANELDKRLNIIGEVVRVLATSVPEPEKRRGPMRGKNYSPSLELIA